MFILITACKNGWLKWLTLENKVNVKSESNFNNNFLLQMFECILVNVFRIVASWQLYNRLTENLQKKIGKKIITDNLRNNNKILTVLLSRLDLCCNALQQSPCTHLCVQLFQNFPQIPNKHGNSLEPTER